MTHAGPWITPTTTRFAQACADPPAVPNIYRRMWSNTNWDVVRFGGGSGPTDTLIVYGDVLTHLAAYATSGLTTFTLSQGVQAYPLSATPAAKLVPYHDVPIPSGALSVEYEATAGTITATPNTQCFVARVPSNSDLAANVDVYQLPSAPAAYTFLDPTALAANAGNLLASLPTFSFTTVGGVFTGKQMASPTDTIRYLYVMHGQDVTPFPYFDGSVVGAVNTLPEVLPSVEYLGPRFRFIYPGLARLRQFPRDDSLGGSPRQGHRNGATSVQASTRQGWRGTYR